MTELTVAIVLSDDAVLCRKAVDHALSQDGVDVEIYLYGSCKEMGEALSSGARVSFIEMKKPLTYSELLHKLATDSHARYVISLPANKHLLPGALSALVKELDRDTKVEMVCALQFASDHGGGINRAAYHDHWERALELQKFDSNCLKDLLTIDFLLGGVKIFRRKPLLTKVFSRQKQDTNYALVWSLHSQLKSRLLREPVCISLGTLPLKDHRFIDTGDYLARVISLFSANSPPERQFGALEVLYQSGQFYWRNSRMRKLGVRWRQKYHRWLITSGLQHSSYRLRAAILQKLPLVQSKTSPGVDSGPKRVGYYLWQYPVLSQTFVQREVAALRRSGNDIVVLSKTEPEHEFLTVLKPALADATLVMPTQTVDELKALKQKFFRKNPLRYVLIYLYVIGHRHHENKSWSFDLGVFNNALKLATLAEQQGIRHLHSPWADNCAFIALLAARMLGISFSVQARAHDIHRDSYKYGLREKFENADFLVTNTRYNADYIRTILHRRHVGKVMQIYNGLNLEQFQAQRDLCKTNTEIHLLCVARLIEQKGLTYLLQACKILLDSGLNIRCDIVGGVEDIYINHYITLRRLHRALRLENKVNFVGAVSFDEVLTYQQGADIFVLPCVIAGDGSRDIIPNSVLEAMAMKLPVVSTTVTGLPEMVEQEKTGFLVPPGDADALAGAIRKLVDSPQLRHDFGIAGRQRVEQLFDSDKNALAYQRLFCGEALG